MKTHFENFFRPGFLCPVRPFDILPSCLNELAQAVSWQFFTCGNTGLLCVCSRSLTRQIDYKETGYGIALQEQMAIFLDKVQLGFFWDTLVRYNVGNL